MYQYDLYPDDKDDGSEDTDLPEESESPLPANPHDIRNSSSHGRHPKQTHHGLSTRRPESHDYRYEHSTHGTRGKGGDKRRPSSVRTVESMSTIPADIDSREDVKEVYQELQEINDKLKREFKILHQRDVVLKQKEQSLSDLQSSLNTAIDNEVKRRLAIKEQEIQVEFKKIDAALKEKMRENRRLKDNFEALKSANDILRRELDTLTLSHDKLEKQHGSVQSRLINLQRKVDYDEKKDSVKEILPSSLTVAPAKTPLEKMSQKEQKSLAKKPKSMLNTCDVLSSLLDWVCESQLRQTSTDPSAPRAAAAQEQLEDKCFKILPALVEMLREQASPGSRMALPCLQFVYWSMVILEGSQSQHQKTSLSSTLRRLGEDLYRGRSARPETGDQQMSPCVGAVDKQKDKATLFFRSAHLHTRLLSCLVILKTLTQVDYLAQVYEALRNDLKSDPGKEYFLYYQATPVMLTHLKPSNKALTSSALDVYLQLSMDSPYVRNFLDSCSQEKWFQSISLIWRMPGIEPKQQEKISIILQKLSKIRSNKKYFEVFGLTKSCQEVQRSASAQSPFLSLNLKSILFNLSGTKTQAKPSSP